MPVSPAPVCARCFKPVDPRDPEVHRNTSTGNWEHKECRTSPRVPPGLRPVKRD